MTAGTFTCFHCGAETADCWEAIAWHTQTYHPETNPFRNEYDERKTAKQRVIARVEDRLKGYLL